MVSHTDEENIIVPEQMSVAELRKWLAQFGEQRKAHYENSRVQKGSAAAPSPQKIQHLEHPVSSTSSTASSSSRDTLGAPHDHDARAENEEEDVVAHVAQELARQTEPLVSSSGIEVVPVDSQDDSIFQSLETFEKDEDIISPPKSTGYIPKHQEEKRNQEYEIVSIRKLLEAPKPMNRPNSEWDEFLDGDDFPDSSPRKLSSFVWHSNSVPKQVLQTNVGSSDSTEDGSVPDETMSVSSVLTGHRKKPAWNDEYDSVSTKSRSSARSLRARLPQLLCKPVKDAEATKMVQRTYANRPKQQARFRSVSPNPHTTFLQSRVAASEAPEPFVTTTSSSSAMNSLRNDDADTTVSCPDFAAASAFLHKFANDKHQEGATKQEESTVERSRRRHRRSHHRSDQKEDDRYGTSAILPGAVNASLGQVFVIDSDDETKSETAYATRNDSRRFRAPSSSSSRRCHTPQSSNDSVSRVRETVSKFGGHYQRESAPSAVQQRQEELEKRFASTRKVQHVKKVKWEVNVTTGSYKKKVVVDHEPSE